MRTSKLGKLYDIEHSIKTEQVNEGANYIEGITESYIAFGDTLPIYATFTEYKYVTDRELDNEVTNELYSRGVIGEFSYSPTLGHYFLVTELK